MKFSQHLPNLSDHYGQETLGYFITEKSLKTAAESKESVLLSKLDSHAWINKAEYKTVKKSRFTYNAWSYDWINNVKSSWCQITVSSFIPGLTKEGYLVICFYLFQEDKENIIHDKNRWEQVFFT